MMRTTTSDELIEAGLTIVSERGLKSVLPEFTVRELIDRAEGPTRSAFQNAWPQRVDFEREVLEEVLAERAKHRPGSITSISRSLDLMESGPNFAQFTRHAYLNAGGEPQQRDLRDRIAVTCLAASDSEMADFAARSERARYAHEDSELVQIFRIAGMVFGLEPFGGFTFLDLAKIVGSLMDGMSLQRLADPVAEFDEHIWKDTPGWSLESVATDAIVATMTVPIGDEHSVPTGRKPHPAQASRPAADIVTPRRPPTTRSLFLDAGVAIVNERGLNCALPSFTIAELLNHVSASVTEGAFHHSWPRKVDFEIELIRHLVAPDTARAQSAALDLTGLRDQVVENSTEVVHRAADLSMSRSIDLSLMFLSTLASVDEVGEAVVDGLSSAFNYRVEALASTLATLAEPLSISPKLPLTWDLLARMGMAVTDGMLLRSMSDALANESSLGQEGQGLPRNLLGFACEGFFANLLEFS